MEIELYEIIYLYSSYNFPHVIHRLGISPLVKDIFVEIKYFDLKPLSMVGKSTKFVV